MTQEFALGFFAVAVVVALPLVGETAQAFDHTRTECVADLNGDNVVDLSDLAALLAVYGTMCE